MNKIFTGIGSRQTPAETLRLMHHFGVELATMGFTLRSGGASGADSAFETGCDIGKGKKEIYLPWPGFNGNQSSLFNIPKEAYSIAAAIHPSWDYLKFSVKNLMARNCMQILGADLKSPTDFVICWTKGGRLVGGTAQAIKLALQRGIMVYNLCNQKDLDLLNLALCFI